MRTTLIPNMIDLLKTNINKKNADRLMFEIGNIYAKNPSSDELPVQLEHIIIGKNNIDFYELKNIINYITNTLNIEELTYKKANEPFLHPGRSAYIYLNDTMLGFIGQIHPSVAVKYDIPFNICLAELSFDEIFNIVKDQKNIIAKQVGKYPAVLRDIAVVCNEDVEVGELKSTIKKYGGKNLISCNVFDVYRNITTLGVGKKSIAFNLKFRSDTETLTDDMIEKTMNEIITGLAHDNNALLR